MWGLPTYVIDLAKLVSFFFTSVITPFLNSRDPRVLSLQNFLSFIALGTHRVLDHTAVTALITTTKALVPTGGKCFPLCRRFSYPDMSTTRESSSWLRFASL